MALTYFVRHRPDQSHASAAEYQHAVFGFLVLASRHLLPAVQNSVNTITEVKLQCRGNRKCVTVKKVKTEYNNKEIPTSPT